MTEKKVLHCPLCLSVLTEHDQMIVFRAAVEVTDQTQERSIVVNCNDSLVDDIKAFAGSEINIVTGTDKMVFLSHVSCRAESLFWTKNVEIEDISSANPPSPLPNSTEDDIDDIFSSLIVDDAPTAGVSKKVLKDMIVIPGKTDGSYTGGECYFDITWNNKKIKAKSAHEILKMLGKTAESYNDHPNMWFPFPLLYNAGKGNLIELIGPQKVGKTILSLQLAQKNGYGSTVTKPFSIAVNDYFYLYDKPSYQKELVMRTEWEENPYSRPGGSANTPGDVRALFVTPSRNPVRASKKDKPKNGTKGSNVLWRSAKAIKSIFSSSLGVLVGGTESHDEIDRGNGDILVQFDGSLSEIFYPAIFYDTAGETQRKGPEETWKIRVYSNTKVILIDAQEIFDDGSQTDESIRAACERLNELHAPMGMEGINKVALVVTKMDLVKDKFDFNQVRQIIETFPATEEEEGDVDTKARKMLVNWLDPADDNKKTLRMFLDSPRLIERVFFVWTEDLPRMEGIRLSPIKNLDRDVTTSLDKNFGKIGDIVTFQVEADYFDGKLEKGEGLDLVEKILFSDIEAEIISKSPKEVQVKIPEGARTGFIGIELKNWHEKNLTGRQIFRITDGVRSRVRTRKPKSYGLAQFLAWCLNVRVTDIINFENETIPVASSNGHSVGEKVGTAPSEDPADNTDEMIEEAI